MANAALLLDAGFLTTVNMLGNGIALLTSHPDQLELLTAQPELWPGAVEEILRYDGPVRMTGRIASCLCSLTLVEFLFPRLESRL